MNQEGSSCRIKYALNLKGWSYETGSKDVLRDSAVKVIPSEYTESMDGELFCPVCFTNLNRVPKDKDFFSNGRSSYFSHVKTYRNVKCDLRSIRGVGKKYETIEEAKKAIDDESLVIIKGFLRNKPVEPEGVAGEYDETPVENMMGPVSDVPIGRHSGESYKLPSKITTVAGICRNFDENIYKYYYFSGQKNAIRLLDLLKNIESVEVEDDIPRLYYGIVESSFTAGENPKPQNIRMTKLKCNNKVHDFYLKATDRLSKEKGITDDSNGRIVLMYGQVSVNGIGLCVEQLKWGEFALLPEKYNRLIL